MSTVLIFFFVKPENAIREDAETAQSYGEYEKPLPESVSVLQVLRQRKAVLFVLLIGCLAAMTNNTVGILLPLQLKEQMGQHGAAVYGYLNSLNGFVVILFTPILTMVLRKLTEIPKAILGMGLFLCGMVLFMNGSAQWLLFVGMFVYTLGEVVTVLGYNPYASRRIPASHRGRIGGLSSVMQSIVQSVTQYSISFVLMAADGNYRLLWMSFIGFGIVIIALYALVYPMDRKRFPKLYCA